MVKYMSLTLGQKAIVENILVGSGDRADLNAFVKAITGDIKFSVLPATSTQAATSAGFTKSVVISLYTANAEVHNWFQNAITASIADTSVAGVATIITTAPTMVDGKCTIVITGNAAAFIAAETVTLTVTATILGYSVLAKTCVITIV